MMSIPGGWNSAGSAQNSTQMTRKLEKIVRAQACAVAPQAGCLYTLPSVAVLQAQYADGKRIWPTVQVPVQSAGRPESCPCSVPAGHRIDQYPCVRAPTQSQQMIGIILFSRLTRLASQMLSAPPDGWAAGGRPSGLPSTRARTPRGTNCGPGDARRQRSPEGGRGPAPDAPGHAPDQRTRRRSLRRSRRRWRCWALPGTFDRGPCGH
eukprot:gene14982-biopygen5157